MLSARYEVEQDRDNVIFDAQKSLSAISSLTTKPRVLWRAMAALTCFKMVALVHRNNSTETDLARFGIQKEITIDCQEVSSKGEVLAFVRTYGGNTIFTVLGICFGLVRVPFPFSTSTMGP